MFSYIVDAEVFPQVTLNNTTEIVYILKIFVYNHIKHNTHNSTNALGKIGFGFFHGGTDSDSLNRLVGCKIQNIKNDIKLKQNSV